MISRLLFDGLLFLLPLIGERRQRDVAKYFTASIPKGQVGALVSRCSNGLFMHERTRLFDHKPGVRYGIHPLTDQTRREDLWT